MSLNLFQSASKGAIISLLVLTFLYFLENFDRYLIAVSPIPYIDYTSYEYSLLAGPAFTIVYTVGGLLLALYFIDESSGKTPGLERKGIWKHTKLLVLSVCSAIFSFAFTATVLCTEFYQLVIIRIAMGLSQSVITPFSTSIIRDVFPPSACGTAFGVFNAGTYFAFSFSLSMGTYVYNEYGWKAGYFWFGIVGMGVALLVPLLSYLQPPSNVEHNSYSALTIDDSVHNIINRNEESKKYEEKSDALPTPSTTYPLSSSPILSTTERMRQTLGEVWSDWRAHPSVLLVCLATGVRLGGGYLWSAYTPLFFSDLFSVEEDSISCQYSYNSTASVDKMCDSDYPYCISEECKALNSYPWHNEGMSALQIEEYMSWVPILGSALGSTMGGVLSDYIIKKYDQNQETMQSLGIRSFICSISNLLSLPLVLYSFFLPSPACFLIYIASGLVGEVYLSQSLALITDRRVVSSHIITPAVALFMLIITIIGGNAPFLIPLFLPAVGFQQDVLIDFTAASADPAAKEEVHWSVENSDAKQLQYSLVYSLAICYALPVVLYMIAYFMMAKEDEGRDRRSASRGDNRDNMVVLQNAEKT